MFLTSGNYRAREHCIRSQEIHNEYIITVITNKLCFSILLTHALLHKLNLFIQILNCSTDSYIFYHYIFILLFKLNDTCITLIVINSFRDRFNIIIIVCRMSDIVITINGWIHFIICFRILACRTFRYCK